jgi:hypothetical protein
MRVLVLMLCLVAGPVWAIDDEGYTTVLGLGGTSCGKMVERHRTKWDTFTYDYAQYINGYITAYNYLKVGKKDWAEGTDADGILLFVLNYCKEHPLKNFNDGVKALMRELDPAFGIGAF